MRPLPLALGTGAGGDDAGAAAGDAAAGDARRRRLLANDDSCKSCIDIWGLGGCEDQTKNGICQDGSYRSWTSDCPCGTDLTDCGTRSVEQCGFDSFEHVKNDNSCEPPYAAIGGYGSDRRLMSDGDDGERRLSTDGRCRDGSGCASFFGISDCIDGDTYQCECGTEIADCGVRSDNRCCRRRRDACSSMTVGGLAVFVGLGPFQLALSICLIILIVQVSTFIKVTPELEHPHTCC